MRAAHTAPVALPARRTFLLTRIDLPPIDGQGPPPIIRAARHGRKRKVGLPYPIPHHNTPGHSSHTRKPPSPQANPTDDRNIRAERCWRAAGAGFRVVEDVSMYRRACSRVLAAVVIVMSISGCGEDHGG